MTQKQIEALDQQEYCHMLAYGDPKRTDQIAYDQAQAYDATDSLIEWISTLDSTTYPGMTFGYLDAPYMYTSL